MRLVRFVAVLVVVLFGCIPRAAAQASWSMPVYNWGSGWCHGCYVFANVDMPNLATPWAETIEGWGFWCPTGELVDRVDVYYWKPGAPLRRAKTHVQSNHLPRPDVQQYFRAFGGCPAVPDDTGWRLAFDESIPPGTWTMSIVWWHGSVSTTQSGLVVVPDR